MVKAYSSKTLFPIVGIGASAGGLEAFRELLEKLPANPGMAFVLVQHLDPARESHLTELLGRMTRLPVVEARNEMTVKINTVFVIPPNRSMEICRLTLKLHPRATAAHAHLPVDQFMRSLAQEHGHKAIGVILSGTASDGAEGIRAIKAAGGITFAQDERTAKYNGMPQAAIATGCVDFVLAPKAIAAELLAVGRHSFFRRPANDSVPLIPENDGTLLRIFQALRSSSGVDFSLYKPNTIHRRIHRRMVVHKIQSLEEYARYLRDHPSEAGTLYEDLLINVTDFFRDPAVFQTLKRKVLPRLLHHRRKEDPIRVWVPGCSTGEEAYSLAITLLEHFGDQPNTPRLQIFATDISERALEKARAGLYPKSIESTVSAARLRRFFIKTQVGYQISKSIRELCIFARQNVIKDPPFSNLDLISCRNVLIYLGPPLQKRVMQIFHYALKPKGHLVLGTSESVTGSENLFAPADKRQRIFLKKMTTTRQSLEIGFTEHPLDRSETILPSAKTARAPDVFREADRLLLGRYAPASVLVNNDLEILQFRGRTGAYLEPGTGAASLNLLKMTREGLLMGVRAAIDRARRTKSPVRQQSLRVRTNGEFREVNLEVVPLRSPDLAEPHFLVMFEERHARAGAAPQPVAEPPVERRTKSQTDREIARLEQELTTTKDYMRSVVEELEGANEELKAANEEIQSSNEELQSSNEELETAKEELQSTNEELTTVNEEMQVRNQELNRVNNDVTNLLSSVNIPILMLGPDLRLRRITPMAERTLHLQPSDLNRPIGDLKLAHNIDGLEAMITAALDTLTVKECEVQDRDGHWYSLWIRPYRTTDNKIDGAVLAFLDIHSLKVSLQESEQLRQYSETIIETVRKPLLVLQPDLSIRSANTAFYKLFKETPAATVGRRIYELGNGQWNLPELRRLLEEVLPKRSMIEDFEVMAEFPRIGRRTMRLNARQLRRDGTMVDLILLSMEDLTELRLLQKAILDISEQERERMGRDLHDGLGQLLAGIAFMVETVSKKLKPQAPAEAASLNKITKRLHEAMDITHDLARGLFPVQLKSEGIMAALRAMAAGIEDMFNVRCRVVSEQPVRIADETVSRHLYRIAQEAVYNAVKHSHCRQVRLEVSSRNGTLTLTVTDDGKGFDTAKLKTTDMGLHIMNYRASVLGANLTIKSQPRQGSSVICTLKKTTG